jgi:hypothetical protein
MEFRLAGDAEVLEENLPQRHLFPSQNPTWPDPGLNPRRRGGKPETNPLSYGAAFVGPWPFFSFLIWYTVGRTPWTGDQSVVRPVFVHTEQHKHRKTHKIQTVGFEHTIPAFKRAKTVHALDRAATVIGTFYCYLSL